MSTGSAIVVKDGSAQYLLWLHNDWHVIIFITQVRPQLHLGAVLVHVESEVRLGYVNVEQFLANELLDLARRLTRWFTCAFAYFHSDVAEFLRKFCRASQGEILLFPVRDADLMRS